MAAARGMPTSAWIPAGKLLKFQVIPKYLPGVEANLPFD
jgi:hypothetical protein